MRSSVDLLHQIPTLPRQALRSTPAFWSRNSIPKSQLSSCPLIPARTRFPAELTPTPSHAFNRGFSSTTRNMTVTNLKSYEEFEDLLCSDKPLVIDFWAAWCGPCKMISPVFEKLSNEIDGLNFVSVDVEDPIFGLQFAQEHGIRAMPTFQIIENGVKVAEMVGADQVKLRTMLADHST